MRYVKFFVLVWTLKQFILASSVVDFLNTLPTERQKTAKVTCWNYACIVYYQIERTTLK